MTKLAILQMSDEPQIYSTAVMLRSAGYEVKTCNAALRAELVQAGCDTVISTSHMEQLGYDRLGSDIQEASPKEMNICDLFVEIKVRNLAPIWNRWPRLHNRTIWWRVNGAQPEICPKGGDEVNLICPLVTACLWYGTERYRNPEKYAQTQSADEHLASRRVDPSVWMEMAATMKMGDNGMAYTFWPPYPKSEKFDKIDRRNLTSYTMPYSLCHSIRAWGYGSIIDECHDRFGIQMFGNNSPDGQISHADVCGYTANSLCLVHLKSVDCPGWALYEALLSGCPVVTPRLMNSRMLAYDLLEDNVTCLEYGVPASLDYGRGDMDFPKCLADIAAALQKLCNPLANAAIGENGRLRLRRLMWNESRDGDEFRAFMERHGL